jgi:heme exporter protein D
VAIALLLLDAALLIYAGVALGRRSFVIWGMVCAAAVPLVVLAWRVYRRRLDEIENERRAMRREVESIRDLLHRHHLNN